MVAWVCDGAAAGGPGLERLLNKIAVADIVLWQIERRTPDVMLARFGMADFAA